MRTEKEQQLHVNQLQFESDGWKRIIGFIVEEHIYCRNHLSEVIKHGPDDASVLLAAESYLAKLALNEDHINILRSDIANHDDLLLKEIYEDGQVARQVTHDRKRLQREIEKLKDSYFQDKCHFDQFLEANT